MPDDLSQNRLTPSATNLTDVSLTLEDAAKLQKDLHGLVGMCETAQLKPGVRLQVQRLARWMDEYCAGLSAAHKIVDGATESLENVKSQVTASLDELLRLEDEGGPVSTSTAQTEVLEGLGHALRRIHRIKPAVESHFHLNSGPNPEPEPEPEPEIDHEDDSPLPEHHIEGDTDDDDDFDDAGDLEDTPASDKINDVDTRKASGSSNAFLRTLGSGI